MGFSVHGKEMGLWGFGVNWFEEVDRTKMMKWKRGFCEKREER